MERSERAWIGAHGKSAAQRVIPLIIALLTATLHLAFSHHYGYFRDELYFMACARHLAWGYPDQPPLVALLALLARPFGWNLLALRAVVAIAAGLNVVVVSALVREIGGGRFAQAVAALSVALLPAYLTLGSVLTTSSLEPLTWSLVALLTVRAMRQPNLTRGALLGAAIAFGTYGKYSMLLWVFALAVGILATKQRQLLFSRAAIAAAIVALFSLAPNFLWQAAHHWPFLEVIRTDFTDRHPFNNGWQFEYHGFFTNTVAFLIEQVLFTNPLVAPLWILGIITALRDKTHRAFGTAFIVTLMIAVVLEAKGYYVIGLYGTALAIGCVAFERATERRSPLRFASLAVALIAALLILPIAAPVLGVNSLISYTQYLGLTGMNGSPPELIQPLFAEEFGWRRMARDVARVYDALPRAQRATTAIYADTYADAGAIDRFGPAFGLPRAIGTQNGYWIWGMHGYDLQRIIALGASREQLLLRAYASCRLLATTTDRYRSVVEGPTPIFLCSRPRISRERLWRSLRWYGA